MNTGQVPPDFALGGKVAIVTGGGGGLGSAYAQTLAMAGASVVVADINGENAKSVADGLVDDGHSAISVVVDITDEESARSMARRTCEEFGGIDILVNDAALMAEIPRVPLIETSVEWWDRVMKVNVCGAFICCQACVPSMIQRGGGKIVNQSSGGAWVSSTVYAVSKLALVGLTMGLARQLGVHQINVNAIAPGTVET